MNDSGGILLATINAKWIHPSLALRLLKANLGPLEKDCSIIEFALRQPLREKIEPLLAARPRILGLSVSIWNHIATLELLNELCRIWGGDNRPIIVLGGSEASYLPPDAEIFQYADYCILGEGEVAFRELCESILEKGEKNSKTIFVNREFQAADVAAIKNAYHLYTDEDLQKKLIYVEASRGCPFGCEFCLSAQSSPVREFPLEPFLAEMDGLVQRGAKTFKFLDRTFNLNIDRARRIMEFFLDKIEKQEAAIRVVRKPSVSEQLPLKNAFLEAESRKNAMTWRQPTGLSNKSIVVHFEMVPSRFPPELIETLARFPSGTLRLEIGIQTLNPEISARIGRPSDPAKELAAIALLREKTNAIIHADLIAGLPGEDMASFGRGFDLLHAHLSCTTCRQAGKHANHSAEIQLGILKLLPGAAIARHTEAFGMCYNTLPPYEVMETSAISAYDLNRLKNFARFWEILVNRKMVNIGGSPVFERFMALSDSLLTRFGRNWGIDKKILQEAARELYQN